MLLLLNLVLVVLNAAHPRARIIESTIFIRGDRCLISPSSTLHGLEV